MTRNGKIARLDEDLRNEINERLSDGINGAEIIDWLNARKDVKEVLKSNFNSAPITKQNLSEWRLGGYRDWQVRRDLLQHASDARESAEEIREYSDRLLIDDVATILTARYAAMLAQWDGEPDSSIASKIELLADLCNSISRLQRNSHRAEEHQFKLGKLQKEKKADENQERIDRDMIHLKVLNRIETLKQAYGGTRDAAMYAAEVVAIENDLSVEELQRITVKQSAGRTKSHRVAPNPTKKQHASEPTESQETKADPDPDNMPPETPDV